MIKKLKQKRVVVFLILLMIGLVLPLNCITHSGRTDSHGGHKDNKNASGLGPYHYHCGGNPPHLHDGGVCPYSSTAQTTTTSSETVEQSTTTKLQTTTSTKKTEPKTIAVKEIKTSKDNIEIFCGTTEKIDVTILPENATDQSVTWKSSDTKVASVNSEGVISANEVGEADITLESSNGKSAIVHVNVEPIKVIRIEINTPNIITKEGDKFSISASVFPSNATDKTLEWSTENPEIASIEDGIVIAKSVGTTKVFCSSKDGVVSETEITVEGNSTSSSDETMGCFSGLLGLAIIIIFVVYFKKLKKYNKD